MSLADRYFEGLEELMTDEQIEKFEIIPPATEDEISRLEKFYPDCPESLLDLWRMKRGTYHEEIDDVYILLPVLSSDVEGGEYPYYLKSCVQILEEAEKELEGLKKAYEILNDRYKKKTITLDQFRIQCADITKKIEKCQKIIDKKS